MPTEIRSNNQDKYRAMCSTCDYEGKIRDTAKEANDDGVKHNQSSGHRTRTQKRRSKTAYDSVSGSGMKKKGGEIKRKYVISGTNGGNLRGGSVYATNANEAKRKWESENKGFRAVRVKTSQENAKTVVRGM